MNNTRSALGKARNHGSAGSGVTHWWRMRISSALLLLLAIWLLFAINTLLAADFAAARLFLSQPWNTAMALLFSWTIFYHGALGLQVIIEDYVDTTWLQTVMLIGLRLAALMLATLATVVILQVTLNLSAAAA